MTKPYNPAAERNRDAILAALKPLLARSRRVLEVGAGTGQHAVHFAAAMGGLTWQATELPASLPGLLAWWRDAGLENLSQPHALDVRVRPWAGADFDVVFTANILHFMSLADVEALFAGAAELLPAAGQLLVYGPFLVDGRHVSEGDAALDRWLAGLDPAYSIRDRGYLIDLAAVHGLQHQQDIALPANNRLICWRRSPSARERSETANQP